MASEDFKRISSRLICGSLSAVKKFFNVNLGKRDATETYVIRYLHPDIRYRELLNGINVRVSRTIQSRKKPDQCSIGDLITLAFMEIDEKGFTFRLLGNEENVGIFLPEIHRNLFGSEIDSSGIKLEAFIEKMCQKGDAYKFFFPFLNLLLSGFYVYHSKELPTKRIPLEDRKIKEGTDLILEAIKEHRKKLSKAKKRELIEIYDVMSSYVESRLGDVMRKKTRAFPKEGVIYIDLSKIYIEEDDKNIDMLCRFLNPQFIYASLAIPIYGSPFILPALVLAIWRSDSVIFSSIPTFWYIDVRSLRDIYTLSMEYVSRFVYEAHWDMEQYGEQILGNQNEGDLFTFIKTITEGAPGYRLESESRLDAIKSLLRRLTGGE